MIGEPGVRGSSNPLETNESFMTCIGISPMKTFEEYDKMVEPPWIGTSKGITSVIPIDVT